jgi:hypothetical protein
MIHYIDFITSAAGSIAPIYLAGIISEQIFNADDIYSKLARHLTSCTSSCVLIIELIVKSPVHFHCSGAE